MFLARSFFKSWAARRGPYSDSVWVFGTRFSGRRVTPRTNASTYLPVNEPVPLLGVLANRVELQDVATRAQLATLAEHTQDAAQREALLALTGDDDASQVRYREQVFVPHKSILDLLDQFPSELVEGTWNRSARFVTHGRGRSPSCPPRIDSVLALPVCLVIRTAGSEIRPSSLA
jgi:hypothetical protein